MKFQSHHSRYSRLFRVAATIVACLIAACLANAQTPLLRYDCEESGESELLDSGPAPILSGILQGSASRTNWTPGNFSQGALSLADSSNMPYVAASGVEKLLGLTNVTLTTWLNLQAEPAGSGSSTSNRRILATQGGSDYAGFSWNMNSSLGNYTATNFTMALYIGGQLGFKYAIGNATVGASNRWVFLAVTYNGVATNSNVKFWWGDETNAVIQLGSTRSCASGPFLTTSENFYVGHTDAAPTTDSAPPALYDDIRIYNSVLTKAQLEAVRASNLPPPPIKAQLTNMVCASNMFTFSFVTQSNRTHTVEFKGDLNETNWQTLMSFPGTGNMTNVSGALVSTNRYYRVGTQ